MQKCYRTSHPQKSPHTHTTPHHQRNTPTQRGIGRAHQHNITTPTRQRTNNALYQLTRTHKIGKERSKTEKRRSITEKRHSKTEKRCSKTGKDVLK